MSEPMDVALSFVIPIYKKPPRVLTKCLKAIADQSLKEYEIICVLDGDDHDAKKAIRGALKAVKAPWKIKVIDHAGASAARNAGIADAVGRYVIAWDADCYIEPHAAKAWVDLLDKNPEYDFCYSGYKFADEMGAIDSAPFDPWLLRVSNFISGCFPIRRDKCPKWDEQLESLQDWSMWLRATANGSKGKYLPGYAFSTEYPDKESISGKGCTPENWLKRMDAVRELHNIPKREVCVTSLSNKMDGIALAKMIDADYMDRPNDKPSHYKTIIQIGFSLNPEIAELHANAWGQEHRKVLFWTRDDVDEVYNSTSLKALEEYSKRFNQAYTMFCEDKAAQRILERAGFTVSILPLPMINKDEPAPMPERPKWLIDASSKYGHVMSVIQKALPDMDIEVSTGITPIDKCSGLIHFYPDRAMSSSIKRFLMNGRHVISNCQNPFTGFLDDWRSDESFIVDMVERLRKVSKQGPNSAAADYYKKTLCPDKLKEALCASAS